MKNKKYFWKAVRKTGEGEFASLTYKDYEHPMFNLFYRVGMTTVPVAGKILIFGTRQSARDFLKKWTGPGVILKVEARNPKVCFTVLRSVLGITDVENLLDTFWEHPSSSSYDVAVSPKGTYSADSVYVVEKAK